MSVDRESHLAQLIRTVSRMPAIGAGSRPRAIALSTLAALGFFAVLLLLPGGASAQGDGPGVSNRTCLDCHSDPALNMPLGDGQLISLYIDEQIFSNSVHGQAGYACVQCHTNLGDYPHPTFSAADRRDLALQLYRACQRCHPGEYERTLDSAHDQVRQEGNREAAICTDCHGAHNTRRLTERETAALMADARSWIPQTCSRCHNAIYEKYLTSVHGSALFEESNLDVPTCIDCHGVHDIEDPRTTQFRLASPGLCAGCHTDEGLMGQYDISTAVLETYVADFHGTTVTLFEKQSPDAETNKPVCYDCHGVHDIKRTDDPEKGLQVRENLLARCQICHPDATTQFPTAWLSHYEPSLDKYPVVFIVDTFYKIFIPSVLGGMGLLVALDIGSRVRKRTSRQLQAPGASSSATGWVPVSSNPGADPAERDPDRDLFAQDSGGDMQEGNADE